MYNCRIKWLFTNKEITVSSFKV